jgi:hypothetical protein
VAAKLSQLGLTLSAEKTTLTHWDKPVRFLGYEIRGIRRERGVGIRARLSVPCEKVTKIRKVIAGVCEYHQIPEADLFTAVGTKYRGFCNYYKYADAPQKVFSTLANSSWWATAHYLARRHKSSIRQMLRRAKRAGHYALIRRGHRSRKTFRQFVGTKEVVLDLFPPPTGNIHQLPPRQNWTVDLLPVNPLGWQSGRSLATRLAALERSQGICEACHRKPVDQVHHIRPLRQKRSLRARVTSDRDQRLTAKALCQQCHLAAHGRSFAPRGESDDRIRNAGCGESRSSSVGRAGRKRVAEKP